MRFLTLEALTLLACSCPLLAVPSSGDEGQVRPGLSQDLPGDFRPLPARTVLALEAFGSDHGEPVPETLVTIPALERRGPLDESGRFLVLEASLPEKVQRGQAVDVLVEAPGYVPFVGSLRLNRVGQRPLSTPLALIPQAPALRPKAAAAATLAWTGTHLVRGGFSAAWDLTAVRASLEGDVRLRATPQGYGRSVRAGLPPDLAFLASLHLAFEDAEGRPSAPRPGAPAAQVLLAQTLDPEVLEEDWRGFEFELRLWRLDRELARLVPQAGPVRVSEDGRFAFGVAAGGLYVVTANELWPVDPDEQRAMGERLRAREAEKARETPAGSDDDGSDSDR